MKSFKKNKKKLLELSRRFTSEIEEALNSPEDSLYSSAGILNPV